MVGTLLITWTLLVGSAGITGKSKILLSGISSKEQCAHAARRLAFREDEFACVEVKTVVYLPVSASNAK